MSRRLEHCLKRPTNFFSVPRLCRWKAGWEISRACALLTGFFNQRLPEPSYTFVWDVEIVLVYLKTSMFDNSQLPDKDLTHKFGIKRNNQLTNPFVLLATRFAYYPVSSHFIFL